MDVSTGDATLSQMRFVAFETNRLLSLRRLFTWLSLFLYFGLTTVWAALLGRDSPRQRAQRLRRAFESKGGAFIKLGLHLSMRVDFMPWVYSSELSRMTDRMKPFPVEQAIAIIERTTRKPLSAIFIRFDPQPILSESVACIYQAILHTGEKVAVRVRRPGIGEQFMADLQAFGW